MRSYLILSCVSMVLALSAASVFAEEPAAQSVASQADSVRIDRDGKKICGYDLMSESERGGYRSMMHQTKSLEDRDEIRAAHCANMRARAKERGVKLDE